MFCDVFSFPYGVYAGTLNSIASIPCPSICHVTLCTAATEQSPQDLQFVLKCSQVSHKITLDLQVIHVIDFCTPN